MMVHWELPWDRPPVRAHALRGVLEVEGNFPVAHHLVVLVKHLIVDSFFLVIEIHAEAAVVKAVVSAGAALALEA